MYDLPQEILPLFKWSTLHLHLRFKQAQYKSLKKSNLIQIYVNVLFFWANVSFLTGANVPFLEQMYQKSWGKCVIFRANVLYLTGANVLRANE